MASALRYITVLLRPEALTPVATLFQAGLGCAVTQLGDVWARVDTGPGGTPIALQVVER